ncbi:hypothetical protein EWM64_g7191 [Hericium alpestre]|uniref:Uncharacterized protein n=1 Tax=Hericium alpestre TaxID=135208 RepID=A0A4Y9ZRF2_9AGAM|nr:hypothetical protein EWM64_g7191 [Hericium alpestre]
MMHDDHLRRLLDQRAARADFHHGRFPSITESSDSPSIYSHAHFSPRPIDRAELDAHTSAFNFAIPSQYRGPHEPRAHIDRDRLNDPSASTLDLDDDSTSSRPNSQTYDDDVLSPEQPEDEEEEVVRMSMLGPKMRMYSPAPWEMEEDTVEEAEEPEDDARSFVSKRGKVRNKGEGFMKGFNLSSLNGRNQSASRPSTESRFSGKEKKYFETSSSYISSSGTLQ